MARGRKPGKGKFVGGRPKGSPNKKGSQKHKINFRCGDDLWEALSLAAAKGVDHSVNIYVRKLLEQSHLRREGLK